MFEAQKKAAGNRQTEGKTLAPFNPKYVLGKENRKTVFDLPALFAACMEKGVECPLDELIPKLSMESNIMVEHILLEQIQKAVNNGIILQSVSPLNGKKIYLLPR